MIPNNFAGRNKFALAKKEAYPKDMLLLIFTEEQDTDKETGLTSEFTSDF